MHHILFNIKFLLSLPSMKAHLESDHFPYMFLHTFNFLLCLCSNSYYFHQMKFSSFASLFFQTIFLSLTAQNSLLRKLPSLEHYLHYVFLRSFCWISLRQSDFGDDFYPHNRSQFCKKDQTPNNLSYHRSSAIEVARSGPSPEWMLLVFRRKICLIYSHISGRNS